MRIHRLLLCTLLLAAPACRSSEPTRMRSLDEIPPEYAELWRAWVAADPAWQELRAEAIADPPRRDFLVDNLIRTMLAAYRKSGFATTEAPRSGPYGRARLELIELGELAAPALSELMPLGNGAAALLATDVLGRIGRPAIPAVLVQLEREDSATARGRAASLLRTLPHGLALEDEVRSALIGRLQSDPEWLVRKTAALALGQRGSRDREVATARLALTRALSDEDQVVARAAAAGLAWLEDPEAIPALINFLQRAIRDASYPNLRIAQDALGRLSGVEESLDVAGWRSWWRTNRPRPKGAQKAASESGARGDSAPRIP
ncbi:MAG: HEAT repeat domain-containing protein [bacterium]|nr:HEAT repeat domain-containing protein [bacterium]